MSRRRSRDLRPDEAELWSRVAETARPLRPKAPRAKGAPAASLPKKKEPAPRFDPFRIGESASRTGAAHVLTPPIGERLAADPVRMDRKTFARMIRGKLKPEGKIDLHGMTLARAHGALTSYLMRAHAEGRRLILVVTGKGRDRDEGGPIPAPRGALRHQVPQWLAQPPLAPLVLQVKEAHRSQGGAGALYVYLRRAGR